MIWDPYDRNLDRRQLRAKGYTDQVSPAVVAALRELGIPPLVVEHDGQPWVLEWAKVFHEHGLGAAIPLSARDPEYRLIVTRLVQPAAHPELRSLAAEAAVNPEYRKDFEKLWRDASEALDNLRNTKD